MTEVLGRATMSARLDRTVETVVPEAKVVALAATLAAGPTMVNATMGGQAPILPVVVMVPTVETVGRDSLHRRRPSHHRRRSCPGLLPYALLSF